MHSSACIVFRMNLSRVPLGLSLLIAVLGLVCLPATAAGGSVTLGPPGLGLWIDLTSAILLIFVGLLLALISVYAGRNLRGQEHVTRFAVLLSLSIVSLALLVAGSTLAVVAVGWTLSGWSLAALVTHRGVTQARQAGMFVARRLALSDVALWAAVLLAASSLPSVHREDLAQGVVSMDQAQIAVIAGLLVSAAVIRSALFPAWRWLPATAEAPSPVSAYLHAGVVNGGGMVLILAWPLVSQAPIALAALVLLGATSVLVATVAARLRTDVKGQLAASTTAQMGYMSVQIGLGLPAVALLHLIGHGFYKAWQFLRAGGEVSRRREALLASPGGQRARGRTWLPVGVVIGSGLLLSAPAIAALFDTFGPVVLVPVATAALAAGIATATAAASAGGNARTVLGTSVTAGGALVGYLWLFLGWDYALAIVLPTEPVWSSTWAWAWVGFLIGVGLVTALSAGRVSRHPDSALALRLLAAGLPALPRGTAAPAAGGWSARGPALDPAVVTGMVEAAGRLLGPAFPLRSFVAAGPVAGMTQWDFRTAADMAARTWGADSYLAESDYRELHRRGVIGERDLAAAGVREVADFLATPEPDLGDAMTEPIMTPAQRRSRAVAALWTAHVWAGPSANAQGGLFARWRRACIEHGWGHRVGLPHADVMAADLPDSPEEAIAAMAADAGVGASDIGLGFSVAEYAALLLTRQPGWASHALWRDRSGGVDSLTDLLALRMAIDLAAGGGQPATGPGAESVDTGDLARRELWQRALEVSTRRPLLAGISERAAGGPDRSADVAAQLVFCIDVRSERVRRHLEASGPYATYGYAGFFGAAVDYQAPSGQRFDQCPVLVAPSHEVVDPRTPGLIRSMSSGATAATKAPLAPLALAEASGLLLGVSGMLQTAAPRATGALADALQARPRPEVTLSQEAAATAVPLPARVDLARAALTMIGLTDDLAPLLVIVGHGATVQNNAFAAAYDCGACGGNPGLANARILVAALNDAQVRDALRREGIRISEDTVAVAGLHNTTTDVITIDQSDAVGPAADALARLRRDLIDVGRAVAAERCATLPGARNPSGRADRLVRLRSRDWAETAPEMGLAGNAAFVAGPRWLTEGNDLAGRVFLHSYDPGLDADGTTLHAIINAPVVVAQWINSQYYFSAVDPHRFGSGDKTTHNVVADIGVISGAYGDLRVGLPWQAVAPRQSDAGTVGSLHQPVRLTVVVYASTQMIDRVLADSPTVVELLDNGWVTLAAVEPATGETFVRAADGVWNGSQVASAPVAPSGVEGIGVPVA